MDPPLAEVSGFAFNVRAELPTWLISPTWVLRLIRSFPPSVCAVNSPLSYMVATEPSAETILPDKRDCAYALVTYSWSWKLLVAVSFLTSLAESGICTY
jgi:hypothetical protein